MKILKKIIRDIFSLDKLLELIVVGTIGAMIVMSKS